MDLRDGRYISPSTPATQVFFDQATPTTEGVVFDPNTPEASDTLYVSSTNSSTWIYRDGSYITYTAPVVNNTEWYITGTTIDAGGNKTASISRTGSIYTVGVDSYFNGVRIGLGKGNIATNTSVGILSLDSNTSGSNNTAIGRQALRLNTTGSYNMAVGTSALVTNTTGSYNAAIGASSLGNNISGGYNVSIGYLAMVNSATGANNSSLGYLSGAYLSNGTTDNATPQNSVFIGANTRSLTNNDTNQIVIGYNAIGKGSNTVQLGNSSVTATYLQGEVNINPIAGQISRAIINSDNNVGALLSFRTANLPRWAIRKDGNETGSNVGGDLSVRRYNDAGAFIDNPISIKRSTGAVTLNSAYTLPTVAPTSGQVLGYLGAGTTQWTTQTFLNARVQTVTSSATVTPVSTNDLVIITAQATGLTLANPTGTFTEGQALMIRIKDNATAQTIAFDTNYRAIGVTLPTTTVISKTLYLGIIYNSTDAKWDIVGLNQQA